MNFWPKHALCALALNLPLIALCRAQENFKPIVDVRFDGPYQQIAGSVGDEWAPTWGRDDVLYTGNNDGSSFGGIANNAIAFGRLEGSSPDGLKGISISSMEDFRGPVAPGPAGALWKTTETIKLDGVTYRFVPCCSAADPALSSCLASSTDGGKTWTKALGADQRIFQDAKFSSPHFVSFGNEMLAGLGKKANDYFYAASYAGEAGIEDTYIVGRVLKEKFAQHNPVDWSFEKDNKTWGPLQEAVPITNSTWIGADGANWKTMNAYSVDGVLYMFVTRCFYPSESNDPKRRHNFVNSSIIKSTDGGVTWTRSSHENYDKPMFPGKGFGTAYFVWYGKDGAATVDNADKYVYAVSNNGHFENGDDYVLGRVLRSKLGVLSAADWSFYKGGNGMQDSSWTSSMDAAKPILTNPGHSSMTGMTYIEPLHRYVMVSWYYHAENFEQGIKDKDLATVLEFFEGSKPWGPWNKVKSFDTGRLGWYTPIIGQRFQTAEDGHSVNVYLYATGFLTKPEGGLDMALYKMNYMSVTLSTKPLQQGDPSFVGGK
jgi:hypothetical protein